MNRITKELKILAFGDSLTKGYIQSGVYHPYTLKLNQHLKNDNLSYIVDDNGLNGEKTDTMISRLKDILNTTKYEMVIIFAGTNDLGWKVDPVTIIENIEKIHKVALEKNLRTMAVTLPINIFEKGESYSIRRKQVNEGIINLTKMNKNMNLCNSEGRIPCNLEDVIFSNEDEDDNKNEYWSDGLHLSSKGYDLLGDLIYNDLKQLLI